jgi:CheY-like chemotaxis protein
MAATILVADDNPVNVKLAKAFVLKAGCTPVLACDGLQAVQVWARHMIPGRTINNALRKIGYEALADLDAQHSTSASDFSGSDSGEGTEEEGAGIAAQRTTAMASTGTAVMEGDVSRASSGSSVDHPGPTPVSVLGGTGAGGAGNAQRPHHHQSHAHHTEPLRAIDAVLMDCEMPVMSGFDAARCIRELEREYGSNPSGSACAHMPSTGVPMHTPIIAVTASAMTGDIERCLAAGMDGYLAKPVRFQQLRSKIEKWVTEGAGGGNAATAAAGAAPK